MPPKKRKAQASGSGTEAKSKVKKSKGSTKDKKEEEVSDFKSEEDTSSSETSAPCSGTNMLKKCGRKPTLKIASWNINGVRAWLKKKGMDFINDEQPDILAVQETKAGEKDIPEEVTGVSGYHTYWQSTEAKGGYAGVGLFTKEKPINVAFGMGMEEHDQEGRLLTAEYEKFYLIAAYVPNSGRGLVRLKYRQKWNSDFLKFIKNLDAKKPIIYTGDLNVAHQEIDLKNPKTNQKTAGFTKEEREDFTKLLNEGFIDTFRRLYPNRTEAYTFWSYMMNARAKNIGWRLDYFVLSERLAESVCDSLIHDKVEGSDHCPISLLLALE